MSVRRKTALVTGGAQGIGLAICERLAGGGSAVVIADLNAEKAKEASEALTRSGSRTMAVKMDVSDEKSIQVAIDRIVSKFGTVDILVNNAGVYKSTPLVNESSTSNWKLCLDVMLTGSFMVARAVAPMMIDKGWGRIVNLGSLMSHNAFGEDAAYCAAKTGMLGLTRSLSADLARYNICVNTICPGNILTDMLRNTATAIESRDGLVPGSWLREQGARIPMGRLGQPEDVAKAVAFFCGDEAAYITGQTLHVNGGQYYQ